LQQAKESRKPIAVVLGRGEAGWGKLSKDGPLGSEAEQILAKCYVCLYVDTSRAPGKRLANAFEISQGSGIVISDSQGKLQAFHHEGNLSRADLVRYLRKYADPKRVVVATDTNPSTRVSYYPSNSRPRYVQPTYAPVFFGGGGGC
jgi:hypothetical protein